MSTQRDVGGRTGRTIAPFVVETAAAESFLKYAKEAIAGK
jgi:hypothetical protein